MLSLLSLPHAVGTNSGWHKQTNTSDMDPAVAVASNQVCQYHAFSVLTSGEIRKTYFPYCDRREQTRKIEYITSSDFEAEGNVLTHFVVVM